MSKITRFLGGTVFASVLLLGSSALPAHAAALTDAQIQAVVSLLQSFGVDSSTIANVNATLHGTTVSKSDCEDLSAQMTIGSTDATTGGQVTRLQNFLQNQGYFNYSGSKGYYGLITANAVGKYQVAHGIVSSTDSNDAGITGPATRSAIGCGANQSEQTTQSVVPTSVTATPAPATNITPTTPVSVAPAISSIGLLPEHSGIIIYGTNLSSSNGNPTVEFSTTQGTLVGKVYFIDMQSIASQKIVISNLKTVNTVSGSVVDLGSGTYHVQVVTSDGTSNAYTLEWTAASATPTISSVHLNMSNGKVTVDGNNLSSLSSLTYSASGTTGTLTRLYSYSSSEAVFYMDTFLANAQLTSPVSFSVSGTGGTSNTYTYNVPVMTSFSINGYSQVTNGFVYVYNVTNPTVSWSSTNASSCVAQSSVNGYTSTATNDFSGTKSASGSEQMMIGDSYSNPRYIELYCVNEDGVSTKPVYGMVGGKG